jgi:Nif-specific regulatory protein
VRRLGANRERAVDLRVVAATHRELERAVAAGRFREDLFYRLAVIPVRVPPLRERSEDVPLLVQHFLARHDRVHRLDPDLLALLQTHRWPGNVRELENEIQHALALAGPGEPLTRAHFSERMGRSVALLEDPALRDLPDEPLRETVARIEAHLIRRALAANGGRRVETARKLGLTREGLYKKMRRLGIG